MDGKQPTYRDWKTRTLSAKTFRVHLERATAPGIAVVLGDVVDLESDGPEQEAEALRILGDDAHRCAMFRSSRGIHRLYRADARLTALKRATVSFPSGLTIRLGGSKGAISVVPPTAGREWIQEVACLNN